MPERKSGESPFLLVKKPGTASRDDISRSFAGDPDRIAVLSRMIATPSTGELLNREINEMYRYALELLGVSADDAEKKMQEFEKRPLTLSKIEVAYASVHGASRRQKS